MWARDKLDSYFYISVGITRDKLNNAVKFQHYRKLRFSDNFFCAIIALQESCPVGQKKTSLDIIFFSTNSPYIKLSVDFKVS